MDDGKMVGKVIFDMDVTDGLMVATAKVGDQARSSFLTSVQ
jgi:hypothetical protein